MSSWDPRRVHVVTSARVQGFAVRISHADLTGDGLLKAAFEVLSNPRYSTAAAGVSVRLRARKRTPVQEAIGATLFCPYPLPLNTYQDVPQKSLRDGKVARRGNAEARNRCHITNVGTVSPP